MNTNTPTHLKTIMRHASKISRAVFFLAGSTLVACSGSGGSAVLPAEPTLALAVQSIKTFHFSWTDVSGETEYRLLENPDGISGFTQVDSIAADATSDDLVVFLPGRFNARYILEACNSAGCVDSNEVSVSGSLVAATGYFKASNTGADDQFGFALALSSDGNTLAVGAPNEDSSATGINNGNPADDTMPDSGAVYIFTRNAGGNWSQQAYVKASNTGAGDQFGASVAIAADGNTLAVGGSDEDSDAKGINGNNNDLAQDSGAVYIFTRNAGAWTQQAYVKASNTGAGDKFGASVAIAADGNRLAVGAVAEDSFSTGINGDQNDNSTIQSGAVYIFVRNSNTWGQQAYVKASNANTADIFGTSVALSATGDTLAVGAMFEASSATGVGGTEGDNSTIQSGAVYIFTFSTGGVWSQQAYIKASNTGTGDMFGKTVALAADGNTLVVGAFSEDSNSTGVNGAQNNDLALDSGAVYVFARVGVSWTQQAYIKASNTEADDRFGWSVALAADGNTLAVGAVGEASNATGINGDVSDNSTGTSGAVFVFTQDSGGIWSQQAYVKASNTGAGDGLGFHMALAADGSTLAVGAVAEASNATGINGDETDNSAASSGAVYLY